MTRRHTAQRAGGEHADHDDADTPLLRRDEQAPEVLGGEARGDLHARAGVEQVVADLHGVERRRAYEPVQCGRVAERRDAPEARLALRLESQKRRDHLGDDVAHGERALGASLGEGVV